VCKCVLYYCHRVTTQLQLTNISYHIIISISGKEYKSKAPRYVIFSKFLLIPTYISYIISYISSVEELVNMYQITLCPRIVQGLKKMKNLNSEYSFFLLDYLALLKNCEKLPLPSSYLFVCPSLCPSACNDLASTGQFFMKFNIWVLSEIMSRLLKFY
jgi:hypothetical protein